MTEVTIYMPTKNRVDLLLRAIGSITSQTHQNWELIVVNDASTDSTEALLTELANRDPRIRFLTQTSSKGGCAARNLAIDAARGTYITGLDDDDIFLPTRLEDMLKIARQGAPMVSCFDLFWSRSGIRKIQRPLRITLPMQITRNYVGNQAMIPTEYIRAIGGFDLNLPALQDYDVWTRLIKKFGPCVVVPSYNQIIYGNDHIERISTNPEKQISGWRQFFEKHQADMTYRNKQLHIARRKALTSRLNALPHAILGADITKFGLKELIRLATRNPMR